MRDAIPAAHAAGVTGVHDKGAEDRRGGLSAGFDADLVVLDGDRVRATMAGGRWVHGHPRAS